MIEVIIETNQEATILRKIQHINSASASKLKSSTDDEVSHQLQFWFLCISIMFYIFIS